MHSDFLQESSLVCNTCFHKPEELFQEDVAVDSDIPDGIRDEDLQGDEGFEDLYFDEHTEFRELECNPLQPLQEQTEALQTTGLSSSQTDPAAESSLPATSTQSQV